MKLDDAIRTAIEYEIRVRDVYVEAAGNVTDESGRKVMRQMAAEEQDHVTWLVDCLKQWKETGRVTDKAIPRRVPTAGEVTERAGILRERLGRELPGVSDQQSDVSMLTRALEVEKETSEFYSRMVQELPAGERTLFERFLEIEKGHLAIVEAELDFVSGSGHWFGLQEFSLEAE